MKILIVCQYYYPENFIITKIAEQLVKDGNQVDVLTGKPNYGYGHIIKEYKNISEQIINGVNIHRTKIHARKKSRLSIILNYLSFWHYSKKWVRHCKTEYDVVYTMSLSPVIMCSAGNLYKKKHGVRHIIHCVDLWPESPVVTKAIKLNSITYKILLKWSKLIYAKADKILIGSPSFSEYFKDILEISTDNLYYVPQCSLVEDDNTPAYDFGAGMHILFCGNLGQIQLIPLITETMKLIDDKNIFFHIIGMGPLSSFLQKEIKDCGLSNVIYHGPMTAANASLYFKGADALYVSLKNDGYVGKTIPNKLMMSMAFGKPIIAVLGGDGKRVLNETGGAVFADENPVSVKDAITALKNMDPHITKQMGLQNKVYYNNNFSLKEITYQIEKYLK